MNSYTVIWSEFAEKQVQAIYEYYYFKASPDIATNLVRSIVHTADPLTQNPYMGQREEALRRLEKKYRYLVFKNYKLIYRVEEETLSIKILDVFDTRLSPIKIGRNG
ncbi:type II toxin-antitoxin system RelE/ParE family toxin [Cyclobacterium salsum]|uniref:type II toxin-antitoxin system RelE/ParE family toxin n=1 Tax=Cyclobacterium salsum TaxID=2666329 RepID=UPI0013917443|nr:type II toxin-antitoxin system RelE/ParE family toxin [Cyclobacterium salsum]